MKNRRLPAESVNEVDTKFVGIDVSKWQGNIDWQKVKDSGVQFAIIRAGYGSSTSQKDAQFERNYAECKRLGIPVGAYWYSYATNTTAATMEAQAFLEVIKGKSFEYPIWFDQEYEPSIKALNNAQRTAIVRAALTALENAGYYAGLYASANWVNSWLNYTELTSFDVWAAQYGSACGSKLPFGMWQYLGSGGTCAGISGACDRDYAYKDYPAIIKGAGLNGFAKANTAHPEGDVDDGGSAAKEPESEQHTATPAVTLYTLKIGPMSVGDKNTLEASAKALGIPVTEAE